MVSRDDVSYVFADFCKRFCRHVYGVEPHRHPLAYQECYEKCLDMTDPLEELFKDITIILEQHGKEIGKIHQDVLENKANIDILRRRINKLAKVI